MKFIVQATAFSIKASMYWAGALGFRDFPGLPAVKENRNDSRWTLHTLISIEAWRGRNKCQQNPKQPR
jgi:hypothetical protein